jgi:hypothetical protein
MLAEAFLVKKLALKGGKNQRMEKGEQKRLTVQLLVVVHDRLVAVHQKLR